MWVLKSNSGNGERLVYLELDNPMKSIGRSSVDVILPGDSSISRLHCTVHVGLKDDCPAGVKTKIGLWIVDCGSKYGTFVQASNNTFTVIPPNIPKILKHGSVIRFGVLESIWSVEYIPLSVCSSVLTASEKLQLRLKVNTLGGDVVSDFSSKCSYLVAGSLRLTEKILLALIHGIPIVTTDFLDQVVVAVKNNKTLPDPKIYRPELKETAVRVEDVNLEPGFQRFKLFSGKKFYVENEGHVQEFKSLIEAAGGNISWITIKNKEKLLENGAVLLEASSAHLSESSLSQDSQIVPEIRDFLEQNNRRIIPSREIALAIAYASVERMCNATRDDFPDGPIPAPKNPIQFSQFTVLEAESQPPGILSEPVSFSADRVADSCESWAEPGLASAARKRPLDDTVETQASKKRHISLESTPRSSASSALSVLNSLRESQPSVECSGYNLKRKTTELVSGAETLKKIKMSDSVEIDSKEVESVSAGLAKPEPVLFGNWVDMTHKKDYTTTPSSNPLSDTIIMLSLVTLAQHYREPANDSRNVKRFTKQNVADCNRTVDLETQPELRDD